MPTIGITLGDQAGIGPEIVDAALASNQLPEGFDYRIIGNRLSSLTLGHPTPETAQAAVSDLEQGASMLSSGEIDAIVTAPVAKEHLHTAGFTFPGQTEFFADRLGVSNYAMCLTGHHLTVGLVTIHQSIASVPTSLTSSEIVRTGQLLANFARKKHNRPAKVAVCGLNPHAGENGAFGSEDDEIIAPAIETLNTGKDQFTGPHPADTIFYPVSLGEYDAVLCMYHDQGLIPLKLLDFATGVNVTLGLPRPRVSPDHGTAFNIAGTGKAIPSSMIHAIQLATKLT